MGLRFRRRISIGPGLRLNLSKSGISTSVGGRGAWFTIGHGKARETVGLPGTGLSYTEQQRIDAPPGEDPASPPSSSRTRAIVWLVLLALVVAIAFLI